MKKILIALLASMVVLAAIGYFFRDKIRGHRARHKVQRIVLVSFDTLHVRFIGPYSTEVDYTPNIDALASAGVTFEQAHTRVPITLPSHASLLAGRLHLSVSC